VAPNERDIVERCLAKDEAACAELVQMYARMVGTVIWRATEDHDAVEDLAQETFLRVFRALPYFDERAKLSTWIYTIAHRIAIDFRRKTGRWREEPLMANDDEFSQKLVERLPARGASDPEEALSRNEAEHLVQEAIRLMPDKYRLPVVYAAIEELDYQAIASILDVPVGTVKTLVFRGKRILKELVISRLKQRDQRR
jgi:RNA polymerase sigma-70 factor (ECF subfamily)